MAKSPPWIKLWWDWYTTRSHIGVGGAGLACGPVLMLFCRAACGNSDGNSCVTSDDVYATQPDGKPITVDQIARVVRFPTDEVQRGLDELISAGTLAVNADGAYGFPGFWRWQETRQASRMRKQRRHMDRHSDGNSDADSDVKRTEDRGKRLKEHRDSSKSLALGLEEIKNLEARYESGLPAEARDACALSRKNGSMKDSVWLTVLRRLDKLPVHAVEHAMRLMTEKHGDGDKNEAYMIGIARRAAKNGGAPRGPARATSREDWVPFEDDSEELLGTKEAADG